MTNKLQKSAGFSMVEFLVAAFVFAVGILGLTALQLMALRQTTTGRGRVTATYVAEQVLQMAQNEGQTSYAALIKGLPRSPVAVDAFTRAPYGDAIPLERLKGGFTWDGVYFPNPTETDPPIFFTVDWARRAYNGEKPSPVDDNDIPIPQDRVAHVQEFVVNVEWTEESGTRYLSMSRNIRY